MKHLLALLTLWLAVPNLDAQIYADFTVSHGGTSLGTFRIELEHERAPRPTAAFIGLATGQRPWIDTTTGAIRTNTPYYDGLIFHRLIHNFVIQGGDPSGTGTGGPGYVFQDQYHADLRHDGPYLLSMAKTSLPNTNGSQFFITLASAPNLDDKHSIFGEVISGHSIIDGFMNSTDFPVIDADGPDDILGTNDDNNKPTQDITMDTVIISGPSLASFDIDDPALLLPTIRGVTPGFTRDATAQTVSFTLPLAAQCHYQISSSPDLAAWTYEADTVFAYGAISNASFGFSNIDDTRYFWRIAEVNYGLLPNSPYNLTASGHTLAFSDRAGNTLTLTFVDANGGTWAHSDTSSGTFSAPPTTPETPRFIWNEYIPSSGGIFDDVDYAHYYPLGYLDILLDSPAGPNGWTALFGNLSFHSDTTGFAEMTANSATNTYSENLSFTYTPD